MSSFAIPLSPPPISPAPFLILTFSVNLDPSTAPTPIPSHPGTPSPPYPISYNYPEDPQSVSFIILSEKNIILNIFQPPLIDLLDFALPPVLQLPPLAHHPFKPTLSIYNLRQMNIQCSSYKALQWLDEDLTKSSKVNPKLGVCCY
jgi:hypothetical protein